jgi:hypothetical protein
MTRYCHIAGNEGFNFRRISCSSRRAGSNQSMRRTFRRSVPFVQAAFIGTFAAALLAGLAILISHLTA